MAIISGVTVNWTVSPRIITIPAPLTEAIVSDVQDTLQDIEDSEEGIIWPHLRNMSGGESLGGGVAVGFTMELQDAQIQFAGRTTATESGAVSSNDTTGTFLNAVGGQFVTNGVSRGDTVFNSTTGSMATVLSVTDETNLVSQQITGGARTTWLNTDTYTIYVNVQCSLLGGNIVAVDDVGGELSPILQSPNTNVIRTSSSSATLANQEQLQASTFAGKEGLGVTVSPLTGTDSTVYPVGTREVPCKTEMNFHSILASRGFRNVYVKDSMTVTGNHSTGHVFFGDNPQTVNIHCDVGSDVSNAKFQDAYVTGKMDTFNIISECRVGDVTNVNGFIFMSAIVGTLTILDNVSINKCWAAPTAPDAQIEIDFNNVAKSVFVSQWEQGKILVTNMAAGSVIHMAGTGGRLIVDASCNSAATVAFGGAIIITNNSSIVPMDSSISTRVWKNTDGADALLKIQTQDKLLKNKTVTDPVSGIMTVYDDDDATPLFTANIWENVAATTAYDGNAINRKDRFT